MFKRLKTVKSRITVIMVLFFLAVATLVAGFSYYLIYTYQRTTAVKSTETNLQAIAGLIQQDLTNLESLAAWCSQSPDILLFFLEEEYDAKLAMKAFDRMQEEFSNNNSKGYIHRLFAVASDYSGVLQVTSVTGAYRTLNRFTAEAYFDFAPEESALWEGLEPDPLAFRDSLVLPYVIPVRNSTVVYSTGQSYSSGDLSIVGTVYMAVHPAVITDRLDLFALEGGSLFFTVGGQSYQYTGEGYHAIEADAGYEILSTDGQTALNPNTLVAEVRLEDGAKGTLVQYPVNDTITITQVLTRAQYQPVQGIWGVMLAGIMLLILALALVVIISLDRGISHPVARLRKRVDSIAGGDFSQDPSIESDSEIGQVGRGVNHLSREVVELMDKRLADEKAKQELEYRMLQGQINPHFVYNTLNSIKWMATLQNAEGIAEMTTALSRLLKTVSKDLRKVVPLREELALLDDYFLILQYRYGGAVSLERHIEEEALLEAMIPRFALQPLVENAIFHGIEPKGAGSIALRVSREGGDVLIAITDNGVGIAPEVITGIFEQGDTEQTADARHLGVHSVHLRIRHVFGEGYGLKVQSEVGVYTTMTLRVPLQAAAKEEETA